MTQGGSGRVMEGRTDKVKHNETAERRRGRSKLVLTETCSAVIGSHSTLRAFYLYVMLYYVSVGLSRRQTSFRCQYMLLCL